MVFKSSIIEVVCIITYDICLYKRIVSDCILKGLRRLFWCKRIEMIKSNKKKDSFIDLKDNKIFFQINWCRTIYTYTYQNNGQFYPYHKIIWNQLIALNPYTLCYPVSIILCNRWCIAFSEVHMEKTSPNNQYLLGFRRLIIQKSYGTAGEHKARHKKLLT